MGWFWCQYNVSHKNWRMMIRLWQSKNSICRLPWWGIILPVLLTVVPMENARFQRWIFVLFVRHVESIRVGTIPRSFHYRDNWIHSLNNATSSTAQSFWSVQQYGSLGLANAFINGIRYLMSQVRYVCNIWHTQEPYIECNLGTKVRRYCTDLCFATLYSTSSTGYRTGIYIGTAVASPPPPTTLARINYRYFYRAATSTVDYGENTSTGSVFFVVWLGTTKCISSTNSVDGLLSVIEVSNHFTQHTFPFCQCIHYRYSRRK